MAGIYSQGGSAGHRYAGWLSEVEAKNFTFGGKVFNGSPSAIYVGSNLVWPAWPWLSKAAKQAIVGAFGQRDGTAVINATNAYLNQLAASGQAGKDKATALAGFINEDPMMVCSLGLEVELTTLPKMPIRFIKNDANGNAYIDTGTRYLPGYSVEAEYQIIQNLDNMNFVIGSYAAGNRYAIRAIDGGGGVWIQFGSGNVCQVGTGFGKHKVIMAEGTCYVDGTAYANSYSLSDNGVNLYLFRASGGTYPSYSRIAYTKVGSGIREMYPFIRNGVFGMIDVLHDQLYTNAGSGQFTEEFGWYVGETFVPWTPSTP